MKRWKVYLCATVFLLLTAVKMVAPAAATDAREVLLPAITIGFNNAVLAEASMSYLGIGVTPPDASLGYMLSEAQGMLTSAPWYALGSGGAIVLLIFGVGLIGEGLQRRNGGVS